MPDAAPWYAERDISTTFAKGLRVLEAFDEKTRSLSMPEIAVATGLDRASVRRLVVTLVHLGYLEKSGRSFALTPRVLGLAGGYLRGNRIGAVVQPILNRFAAELDHEISLAALEGETAIYVAQSSQRGSAVSFGFTVGSRLPVLHTAVGRMLLACACPDCAAHMVETGALPAHTPHSLQDRGRILAELRQIAAQGHAFVQQEFEAGVSALAVPVGPAPVARVVLGLSDQAQRLAEPTVRQATLAHLQQCASELDRTMVFKGDW